MRTLAWSAVLFLAGIAVGYSQREVRTEVRTVELKGEERVIIKDRIVKVTEKPDGTKTTVTTVKDRTKNVKQKVTQEAETKSQASKKKTRLSISYHTFPGRMGDPLLERSFAAVGYRLWDSPFWIEGGFTRLEGKHGLTAGIRVEW